MSPGDVRVSEHRLVTPRRARYYTEGGGEVPLPEAWIVLHGFGQLARNFISAFAHLAAPGRLLVAPEALNRFYVDRESSGSTAEASVGATWMTREDRDAEIADYVDLLDAVHGETAAGAARLTVLGFSQGVATACRWIASGKVRPDRLIAWAGQLPPDVNTASLSVVKEGLVLVVGSRDQFTRWIDEGDHARRLESAGIPYQVVTFEGGHRLDRETLQRLATGR